MKDNTGYELMQQTTQKEKAQSQEIPIQKNTREYTQLKKELKSVILDKGFVFGSGLNPNNQRYAWTSDTKSYLLDPKYLDITANLFLEKIKKYKPEAVGGLTLASHIIASAISYLSMDEEDYDAFLVRRERKEYNMAKLIEGPDISGKKVVIIDDGLNAAGFAKQAIDSVEAIGCKVLAVIILNNFERKDFEELSAKGYVVESIFTLKELGMDADHAEKDPDLYTLTWRYCVVNSSDYTAPKSSPVIDNEKVYVGSDQGKLMCFDFNGLLLWEFLTEPDTHGVHQTPIIIDDKVVFSAYDGFVYALNKENGALIWKNNASSFSGASPVYDRKTDTIFVGTENATVLGAMAAIDSKTGRVKWEYMTSSHVTARVVIRNDLLIFSSNDCNIYCMDKKSAKLHWSFRTDGEVKGRLTVDEDYIYATSFDGCLYCLDLKGTLIWKKKLGIRLYSAPLIVDDMVVIGSMSKQVSALDKKTGKVLWHFMTKGQIQSYPTLFEDRIFVGSRDGCIYILDKEGTLVWRFITSGPIASSPTCYKDKLFVSGNDGYLYCFKKNFHDEK